MEKGLPAHDQDAGYLGAAAPPSTYTPTAIAACFGASDAFDRSVADLSQRYADQNERDY